MLGVGEWGQDTGWGQDIGSYQASYLGCEEAKLEAEAGVVQCPEQDVACDERRGGREHDHACLDQTQDHQQSEQYNLKRLLPSEA